VGPLVYLAAQKSTASDRQGLRSCRKTGHKPDSMGCNTAFPRKYACQQSRQSRRRWAAARAPAYLANPEFATGTQDLYVDIKGVFGKGYGKSIVYSGGTYPYAPIGRLQKSTGIFSLNHAAFYVFYFDLLTRPVPVQSDCTPHDVDD
jgi:hypothetical protein